MAKIILSNDNLDLDEIEEYYEDSRKSIEYMFQANNIVQLNLQQYFFLSQQELNEIKQERLQELEIGVILQILSSLEASFRKDYITRCKTKSRDEVSRVFREKYKELETKIGLEDLLDIWKEKTNGSTSCIGNFKGALHYRHWLAHGRYWSFKKQKYDYFSAISIASSIYASFPLQR